MIKSESSRKVQKRWKCWVQGRVSMALPIWDGGREIRMVEGEALPECGEGTCTARMTGGKKGGWRIEAGD